MARNKFEQDEADVLNIYAKVNGGELLGASGSYGGIFIYFLNDFNTNMVRFNHNILYDVMLKKFRFLIKWKWPVYGSIVIIPSFIENMNEWLS